LDEKAASWRLAIRAVETLRLGTLRLGPGAIGCAADPKRVDVSLAY
jgi:hypothetical protein